ncbi:hypothetical protein BD626DRAFT_498685 [Schizophyllum amplum]|uniref:Uncharacterized protein n=1 Tax=Schizophyllum amplum TaxID=97359 RepID=A0A550CBV5_9AGAR|nr:hypothetical protein BD626DRAFT_498685 [Auriculariopsis ampla]
MRTWWLVGWVRTTGGRVLGRRSVDGGFLESGLLSRRLIYARSRPNTNSATHGSPCNRPALACGARVVDEGR